MTEEAFVRLNLKDYRRCVQAFQDVFNRSFKMADMRAVTEEVAEFVSELVVSYPTYAFGNQEAVQSVNNLIFSDSRVRMFVLELLENFATEIAPIPFAFSRLIDVLAFSTSNCKAVRKQYTPESPILEGIAVSEEESRKLYLQNPWLVVLTLLIRYLPMTELGSRWNKNLGTSSM